MRYFSGQVVWITGASSGIGEALCRAFARAGARIVLSSRRVAELERVRASCEHSDDHLVLPLDLTQPKAFPAAVSDVIARFGRIDMLVNNGGVSQRALAIETSAAVEREIMEIDYFAAVSLTKAVLPVMLAHKAGHIVVVSSVMGYVGTPGRSSYAAAKHALHGYFDSLRAEIARDGVFVTIACPGYVQTAVSANALGPRGDKHSRTDARTARGIPPDRCAAAILRGVRRRRNEVIVGGWETLGIYLQRFAPWLYACVVRKMTFSVDARS